MEGIEALAKSTGATQAFLRALRKRIYAGRPTMMHPIDGPHNPTTDMRSDRIFATICMAALYKYGITVKEMEKKEDSPSPKTIPRSI